MEAGSLVFILPHFYLSSWFFSVGAFFILLKVLRDFLLQFSKPPNPPASFVDLLLNDKV